MHSLRDHWASNDFSVNLVALDNGGGLSTDLDVLTNLLCSLGCRVKINGLPKRYHNDARIVGRLRRRLQYGYVAARPLT
jgi:hypothetical protein